MSFRSRLLAFFLLIVVIPMTAVAYFAIQVSDDSSNGKTDSRLDASLQTAQAVYDESVGRAPAEAERIITREVVDAVVEGKRRVLVTVARREVRRNRISSVAFFGPDGDELVREGARGAIGRRLTLKDGDREVGTIKVGTLGADAFVKSASKLSAAELALVDLDGRVIARSIDLDASDLPGTEDGSIDLVVGSGMFRARALRLGEDPGPYLVALTRQDGSDGFGSSEPTVLAALAGFIVLALALIFYVLRQLQSQMQSMFTAARRIGDGDFSQRVPVEGSDEMAGLAKEFNRMSDRLKDQVDQLQRQRSELEKSTERIGEAFASGLDQTALLEVVVESAVSASDADGGRITLDFKDEQATVDAGTPKGSTIDGPLAQARTAAMETGEAAFAGADGAFALAHPMRAASGEHGLLGTLAVARSGTEFAESERELIRYLAGQAAVSVENIELHERVSAQAVTDGLTGLANKRRFQDQMSAELDRQRRFGGSLSVILLDLDNFKSVNDDYGHLQGDEALREIARVLEGESRDIDEPARYGGEEFIVALPRTEKEGAMEVAERIRSGIERATIKGVEDNPSIGVTASLGVATIPDDGSDALEAVEAADQALYAAKRGGKNCVRDAAGL